MGHTGLLMEPNVTTKDLTINRADPTILIGVPSPSANFVIIGGTLQNHVPGLIPQMHPSIVLIHQHEWIKIGC